MPICKRSQNSIFTTFDHFSTYPPCWRKQQFKERRTGYPSCNRRPVYTDTSKLWLSVSTTLISEFISLFQNAMSLTRSPKQFHIQKRNRKSKYEIFGLCNWNCQKYNHYQLCNNRIYWFAKALVLCLRNYGYFIIFQLLEIKLIEI